MTDRMTIEMNRILVKKLELPEEINKKISYYLPYNKGAFWDYGCKSCGWCPAFNQCHIMNGECSEMKRIYKYIKYNEEEDCLIYINKYTGKKINVFI